MKKISPQVRRRMLADAEAGLSRGEVKKKYDIRDTRTVEKHLAIAEREREEREARVQLLKEHLGAHMDEVRQVVEQWQKCFSVRPVQDIHWSGPDPFQEVEQLALFESLRSHLPHRELWRDYELLKEGILAYLQGASGLREEAGAKVSEVSGLPLVDDLKEVGALKAYGDSAFELAAKIAHGIYREERLPGLYRETPVGEPEGDRRMLLVDGRGILSAPGDVLAYRDNHLNLVRRLAKGRKMANLVKSYLTLSELAERIRHRIGLSLLRRQYILYRCDLCPGQTKK